jgi:hypothetical protein
MVAFRVLPVESYTQMPAPSPLFRTILELILWNDLQNCYRVTPVIIVIKIPPFQCLLYFREQKKVTGD